MLTPISRCKESSCLFSSQSDATVQNTRLLLCAPESKVFECSPGGNDTYIVQNQNLSREQYQPVNLFLLRHFPQFEQGGFFEPAADARAVARLQMAGGEFCGNAARAFGALLAQDYLQERLFARLVKYHTVAPSKNGLRFSIEVSGATEPLAVEVTPGATYQVALSVPVDRAPELVVETSLLLERKRCGATVVNLEGISHVVLSGDDIPFRAAPEWYRSVIREVITQLGLSEKPAVGLLWVTEQEGSPRLDPVVWVRGTDTCMYESACGSGSVAVALAKRSTGGGRLVQVCQPSGSVLDVSIDDTDTLRLSAKLSGPVLLRGEIKFSREDLCA